MLKLIKIIKISFINSKTSNHDNFNKINLILRKSLTDRVYQTRNKVIL